MGTTRLGSVVSRNANLNPFQLVLVGAERTRQLLRGSRPMLETEANHPTSVVLEEFSAGLLQAERPDGGSTLLPEDAESDNATD